MNPGEFAKLCKQLRDLGVTQVVTPCGYQASWIGEQPSDQPGDDTSPRVGFMVDVPCDGGDDDEDDSE